MSLKDIGKKYSYIYKINEELFIMFQPENPWSLDRVMNGIKQRCGYEYPIQ